MSEQPLAETAQFEHGVSIWPGDGRWAAACRYHGLLAAAHDQAFAEEAWLRHQSRDCVIPTIEERASTVYDAQSNLTGYFVPIDLWREVRAALRRGDETSSPPGQQPAHPGGDQ